jgi:DNA-nicking Smr family endonuclease
MEPVKKRSAKLPATDRADAAADDVDAFALEMRDVVRLESDSRGRVRSVAPISLPRDSPQRTEDEDLSDNVFVAPGVDRREIRKLKKGDYIVRDRRDLHGMRGADALASVERFIENSRRAGHRCVCVIHGRGLHSEGNKPILKARVREYLRSHRSVLAYTDAPVSDGSSGAVYVLLRK